VAASAPRRAARPGVTCAAADSYARDRGSKPRFVQHKNEAKAFYAFLSQVYDYIVNPGHWTVDMRAEALAPAKLDSAALRVVDVGGGTGFTTQGIVQAVAPSNVILLDQSPQQLDKARKKKDLEGVTIIEVSARRCSGGALGPALLLFRHTLDDLHDAPITRL
jgi:MPBQ/MSBQ methyltransferase